MNLENILTHIEKLARSETIRLTQHAQQEMVEENITLDEVLQSISNGQILENYPEHKRGSCCLVYGVSHDGRPMHIVCTSGDPILIIITVYEPKAPKWLSPTQRRPR